MNERRLQNVLLVLLVVASLLTTALLSLMVLRGRHGATIASLEEPVAVESALSAWRPQSDPAQALPVFAALPDFELTDQSGSTVRRDDLRGKVWLADFIFTRCSGPCPIMTQRMSLLQHELSRWPTWDDIRLISFSVDPTYDTPEVLTAYARRFDADATHWRFLTGSRDAIWNLSQKGFLLGVGDDPADPDMPIFHSQKVALVDRAGQVRGYYNIMQQRGRDELLGDLRALVDEPAATGSATREE